MEKDFTQNRYLLLTGSLMSILSVHVYWWHCMHAWFIHRYDMYRRYAECSVNFFTPFTVYRRDKKIHGIRKFVQYFEFLAECCHFLLIPALLTQENITCVLHVTLRYLCRVHKPSHVKVWTANWDNYLAINPYQDTPLGSFVAFAAVIVYIGNLNKI